MTTYHGVLFFHSETGTEGGAWAFQDDKFTGLDAGQQFRCTRCGRVWDKDAQADPPPPHFTYWRDAWTENGKNYIAGYFGSDVYLPDGKLARDGDELNARWTRSFNETSRLCAEEGHPEWQNMYPDGKWSYEGLHLLHDGDQLTVIEHEQELFHGVIQLPPRQDPYAEGAYAAAGNLAAHRRPPIGTDEAWFFENKRAVLVTAE